MSVIRVGVKCVTMCVRTPTGVTAVPAVQDLSSNQTEQPAEVNLLNAPLIAAPPPSLPSGANKLMPAAIPLTLILS